MAAGLQDVVNSLDVGDDVVRCVDEKHRRNAVPHF